MACLAVDFCLRPSNIWLRRSAGAWVGEPAAAVGRLSVAVAPERKVSGVAAAEWAAAVFLTRAGRGPFFRGGTGGVSVVNSSGSTDFLVGDLAMRKGNSARKLAAEERYKRRVQCNHSGGSRPSLREVR